MVADDWCAGGIGAKPCRERTRAGVKAAKARGVKFGRKRKLTQQQVAHARKLIDDDESPKAVAAGYSVSRATRYRALAG